MSRNWPKKAASGFGLHRRKNPVNKPIQGQRTPRSHPEGRRFESGCLCQPWVAGTTATTVTPVIAEKKKVLARAQTLPPPLDLGVGETVHRRLEANNASAKARF